MANVEEAKTSLETPGRNGRDEDAQARTRSSTSLNNENYDMVWREARRRGYPMTVTLNLMLEELREWREGKRKFSERRKQAR